MTDKEVMQMALDALERALSDDQPYIVNCKQTVEALRAALAQPEPKPVAWMLTELDGTPLIDCGDLVVKQRPVLVSDKTDCIPLYTAPPQREWVGLTPKERDELVLRASALLDHIYEYGTISEGIAPRLKSLFTAVEAKLKEKNGY